MEPMATPVIKQTQSPPHGSLTRSLEEGPISEVLPRVPKEWLRQLRREAAFFSVNFKTYLAGARVSPGRHRVLGATPFPRTA